MLKFFPLITFQSLHNLLCGLAKCTLHSYISLKGIPESCDALTKLHFREGKFADKQVYKFSKIIKYFLNKTTQFKSTLF